MEFIIFGLIGVFFWFLILHAVIRNGVAQGILRADELRKRLTEKAEAKARKQAEREQRELSGP